MTCGDAAGTINCSSSRRCERAGDAAAARQVMESHMKMARDLMEDQEAEVMKRFIAE